MATVDVDILQIDTSKSQQSIAGLKGEIKALKDQLINLEAGTKEYNDVLQQLGEKTHTLREATYRINEASTEFNNNVQNLRGTIAGAAGAFQTVIGSLSLMGVQMGDDIKMLKMLQSAMAVTQGITAIQSGVIAFKRLTVGIKAATVAAGGLGKALKALTLSNPFTAILAGATAVIAIFSKITSAAEENAQKVKEFYEKAAADAEETIGDADTMKKYFDLTEQYALQMQVEIERANKKVAEMMETYGGDEVWATEKVIEEIKKKRIEAIRDGQTFVQNQLEIQLAYLSHSEKAMVTVLERLQGIYNQYTDEQKKRAKEQEDAAKKAAEAARKAAEQRKADLEKIAQIERDAQIGLMGDEQGELARLKDKYDEQVKLYQKRGQDIATLTEYYEKQKKEIEDKYEKQREEAAAEAREKVQAERELAADVEYRMQQAAIILENKKTADDELLQLDIDFNCRQQELLHERLEQNLITEQEYADQMATLELEAANLQIEQEQRVTEKTKAELEKRKKIHQNYAKATGTVVDSVCNILGSIGSTLEQGTAEWKAVMTAQAIISTIKGGIDSYMGMIASIPGPAGIIAGVAAAVATVAAGMAEVAKIQSTEVSTTGSSSASTNSNTALGNVNAGAVSMLSTQVTNTRNIATEDDITELPATRVYVLESDITESQNRVRTTVENSTY